MNSAPQDRARPTAWIVGASADRTLFVRREGDGSTRLLKRYDGGSPADAEREARSGRLAAGPGVAVMREVVADPESGRACVVQDYVDGVDLESLVRRDGACATSTAAAIGASLARTLARLAALRVDHAPYGLAHGDVKPSNVLVPSAAEPRIDATVLVDFEHATPAPAPDAGGLPTAAGFCGGTHGWAAPETYEGRPPTPAADVFGLGAILFWLATGTAPFARSTRDAHDGDVHAAELAVRRGLRARWRLDGCDPRLCACIERCLSPIAAARPTAAELADELGGIAASSDGARARRDAARLAAIAGDATPLDTAFPDDARTRRRLARRAIVAANTILPAVDPEARIDELVAALPRALRIVDRTLRIAPRLRVARERRRTCEAALRRVLVEAPQEVQRLRRAARPGEALALCECALDAARLAGRLGVPAGATTVTAIERDPTRFLDRMRRDVSAARDAHAAILRRIETGEARGDLAAIDMAIVELSATYGGASPVVASTKDRRNRLEFYLDRLRRLARARGGLEAVARETGLAVDLSPLDAFAGTDAKDAEAHPPRALLRALDDVAREFPAIRGAVDPARAAVQRALVAVTSHAWQIVGDAEKQLTTPPIPIRPLVEHLDRLDRLRQFDAFVDVDAGSRTDLADATERLRARIEQARAERDRITRGARESLDRGHLTTAIYDMERAVDRFGEGVDDTTAPSLAAEYEAALRRKREIEDALERSHVLAARYGELLATAGSTPQARLAVLREREQTLAFLATNLGAERGVPYVQDLRDVQLDVLRETAADGERRLASAREVAERRAIAQRTLDAILHAVPDAADEAESQQVRALIQTWSDRAEAAAGSLRRERGDSSRRSWRAARVVFAGAAGLGLAIALWWSTRPAGPAPAEQLRTALGEPVPIRTGEAGVAFDAAVSVTALRAFGQVLGRLGHAELAEHARAAADAVDDVTAQRAEFESARQAIVGFRTAVTRHFDSDIEAPCDEFVRRAIRAGFVAAVASRPSAALAHLLRDDELLRQALTFDEAAAIEAALVR